MTATTSSTFNQEGPAGTALPSPPPPNQSHPYKPHACPTCHKQFARSDNLRKHQINQHHLVVPAIKKRKSRAPIDPQASTSALNQEISHQPAPIVQAADPSDLMAHDVPAAPANDPPVPQAMPAEEQDQQNEHVRPLVDAHLYRIYATLPRAVPRFGLEEVSYWVRLTDAAANEVALANEGLGTTVDVLVRAIAALLVQVTAPLQPRDLVQLVLSNGPTLDYPILIGPVRKDLLTVQYLLDEIMAVLNSNQQFVIGDQLQLQVTTIRLPLGAGFRFAEPLAEDKWMHDAFSIVPVRNRDQLCFARALVLALANMITGLFEKAFQDGAPPPKAPDWVEGNPVLTPMWAKRCHYSAMKERDPPQREAALRLIEFVGLHQQACGIDECHLVQDRLLTPLNIRLVVFSLRKHAGTMFNGPDTLANNIYLYYNSQHYHMVTSPKAFINCSYFCELCLKPHAQRGAHRCAMTCFRCHQANEAACTGPLQQCKDCLCWMAGPDCMAKHLQLATCKRRGYCRKCRVYLRSPTEIAEHRCGQTKCRLCDTVYNIEEKHQCYMKCHVPKPKAGHMRVKDGGTEEDEDDIDLYNAMTDMMAKPKATYRYVAWDVETAQHVVQESERVELVVNCVAARMVCSVCVDFPLSEPCEGCGEQRAVCYLGENAMDQFCTWLTATDRGDPDERLETIAFAHNFKAFDSLPLLAYIFSKNIIPELIMTGCKVMGLKLPDQKIKFLDSLNFMPMALRALPRAMGLSTNLAKGDFPHRFNRMENMGKKFDCHPPASYYDPGSMKPEARAEFEAWHQTVKNKPFDFDKELRQYCINDVQVLLRAVLAFRRQFMTMTQDRSKAPEGVDPYFSCMTLASACNLTFRQLFLQPETLATIPSFGYNPQHKQSLEAIQWLCYLMSTDQAKYGAIRHARNGGEVTIASVGKVDGYYEDADSGEKHVFEYQVSLENGTQCLVQNHIFVMSVFFFCLFRVVFITAALDATNLMI